MKFDFCIGNPPYQEETAKKETANGQKRRRSIFQYFQEAADSISKESSVLIYPAARWIHRSGKGMSQFGLKQINDPKLDKLIVYPQATEVFPTTEISDGISIVVKKNKKNSHSFRYIYREKGKEFKNLINSPGENLIPLDPRDTNITNKIRIFTNKNSLNFIYDSVLSQKLFGIESDFVEKNPDRVRPLEQNSKFNPDTEVKLLTNDRAGSAGRAQWFIVNREEIPQGQQYIDTFKVVVSSANAAGKKRDSQMEILDNHSAFGRARVALKTFNTEIEAQNFFNYAKTYLVQYAFILTGDALTSLGKLVPDLGDYTDRCPFLDFSKDINKQLFELVGLTNEEAEYVKEKIDTLR